jgi:hypothetical protein
MYYVVEMFIKITTKTIGAKTHHYASLVENKRIGKKVVQTTKAYLGSVTEDQIPYLKAAYAKEKPRLVFGGDSAKVGGSMGSKECFSISNLNSETRKEYWDLLASFKEKHPEVVIAPDSGTEIERFLDKVRGDDGPRDRSFFMRLEQGLSDAAKSDARQAYKAVAESEDIPGPGPGLANNRGLKKKLHSDRR